MFIHTAWIVKDAVTVVVVYNVITWSEPVHTDVTQGCTEINVIKVKHQNKNFSVTRAFRISQLMDRAVLRMRQTGIQQVWHDKDPSLLNCHELQTKILLKMMKFLYTCMERYKNMIKVMWRWSSFNKDEKWLFFSIAVCCFNVSLAFHFYAWLEGWKETFKVLKKLLKKNGDFFQILNW